VCLTVSTPIDRSFAMSLFERPRASALRPALRASTGHCALPNAQLRTIEGQPHNVDHKAIGPVLPELFRS
jgi:hypothetical protein